MAKMFYTLDETINATGLNEEELKQVAREGRLREFRDGPRIMFKADQVDNLAAEINYSPPPVDERRGSLDQLVVDCYLSMFTKGVTECLARDIVKDPVTLRQYGIRLEGEELLREVQKVVNECAEAARKAVRGLP
jgi:hypothetical protein